MCPPADDLDVGDYVTDGIPEIAREFMDKVYASGGEDNAAARATLKQIMDNAQELYVEAECRYSALMDIYYSGPFNH